MTAPRKIYELEEAERELVGALESVPEGSLSDFELGLLAGKLAGLRWALGRAPSLRSRVRALPSTGREGLIDNDRSSAGAPSTG